MRSPFRLYVSPLSTFELVDFYEIQYEGQAVEGDLDVVIFLSRSFNHIGTNSYSVSFGAYSNEYEC
jgi:hypothetical protein